MIVFCDQSTVGKDGAVMGVTVTRMSMNLHTQVLSQACSYTEGNNSFNKVSVNATSKLSLCIAKQLLMKYRFLKYSSALQPAWHLTVRKCALKVRHHPGSSRTEK